MSIATLRPSLFRYCLMTEKRIPRLGWFLMHVGRQLVFVKFGKYATASQDWDFQFWPTKNTNFSLT